MSATRSLANRLMMEAGSSFLLYAQRKQDLLIGYMDETIIATAGNPSPALFVQPAAGL